MLVRIASSEDPDQTASLVLSDLGLRCLPLLHAASVRTFRTSIEYVIFQ